MRTARDAGDTKRVAFHHETVTMETIKHWIQHVFSSCTSDQSEPRMQGLLNRFGRYYKSVCVHVCVFIRVCVCTVCV